MAGGRGVLVGRGYVSIRPEFEGNWRRTVASQGSAAGEMFAGAFGKVLGSIAVPVAAVGVSVGAALASSFAAAGAGAGAFKAAVQPQLASVTEASDLYTKAQEAAAEGGEKAKQAQEAYRQALEKMPPATRATAKSFIGLKSDFTAWSDSLAGTTMPLFTRGIELLRDLLPRLTPLVKSASVAFQGFMDNLGEGQTGRVFGEFEANMRRLAGPSLTSFLNMAKNIATGFLGILNAFAPMSAGVTGGLERMTERFANFGATLQDRPEFQRFLGYVRQNAPLVLTLVESLAQTAGRLVVALGPLGGVTLLVATNFAEIIAQIPTPVLEKLVTVVALAVLGMKAYALAAGIVALATRAWAGAQALFNVVMNANPIFLVITALAALGAILVIVYKKNETFRKIVQSAWEGIKIVVSTVWNVFLKPVFNLFAAALQKVGQVASWLYENVIGPVFGLIGTVISSAWTYVIKPVLGFFVDILRAVGREAQRLWDTYIGPAFTKIGAMIRNWWMANVQPHMGKVKAALRQVGDAAKWLADNIVKPGFQKMGRAIQLFWTVARPALRAAYDFVKNVLGPVIGWLWRNVASPSFRAIGTVIINSWRYVIKPTFSALGRALENIGLAFRAARIAIGRQWGQLQSITRRPVEFIVNTVYNRALRGVWNPIAGLVGMKKLPAAHFAEGGRTRGGIPGRDSIPALMMADEYVIKRDSARSIGFGNLNYMNATGQLPGFADGGLVGDIWGGIKGLASKAGSALAGGMDLFMNPGKAWDKATRFIRNMVGQISGGSQWSAGVGRIPLEMLSGLKEKLVKAAESALSFGGAGNIGGSGVQRWAPLVTQVLRMLGQSVKWLPTVLRRMNQESGGNPRAMNAWDSNAAQGYDMRSKGLMQTIGPTFRAYAGPFKSRGIWDPLANTYAGLNYALHRYGSLSALNRPGGYDSGGWLMPGQLGYNGLTTPEAVLTPSQWNALSSAAARGTGGGEIGDLTVKVFVGDREITDITRAEVRRSNGELVQALGANRRG